jgi:hypothetical protein
MGNNIGEAKSRILGQGSSCTELTSHSSIIEFDRCILKN